MGLVGQRVALVQIGESSQSFRHALARALDGRSPATVESLDAAFAVASRAVLLAGDGVDPVAPIHGCTRERRPYVLVACERAEGSEVARWARAGPPRGT